MRPSGLDLTTDIRPLDFTDRQVYFDGQLIPHPCVIVAARSDRRIVDSIRFSTMSARCPDIAVAMLPDRECDQVDLIRAVYSAVSAPRLWRIGHWEALTDALLILGDEDVIQHADGIVLVVDGTLSSFVPSLDHHYEFISRLVEAGSHLDNWDAGLQVVIRLPTAEDCQALRSTYPEELSRRMIYAAP